MSACLTLGVLALFPGLSAATTLIDIQPGIQIISGLGIDNTGLAGNGFANRPNTWAAIEDLRTQSPGLAFTDNSSIGGMGTPSRGREVPLYNLDMFEGGTAWQATPDSVVWTGDGHTFTRPVDGREGIARQTYTDPRFGASWVEHPLQNGLGQLAAMSYDMVGGEVFAGFFVFEDLGNRGATAQLVGRDDAGNVVFDYTTPRAARAVYDWLPWSATSFLGWIIDDPDLGLSSLELYIHQWDPTRVTDYVGIAMTGFSYTVPTQNGGGSVPEPATVALLALGLAGLGASRRRKPAGYAEGLCGHPGISPATDPSRVETLAQGSRCV